MRLLQVSDDFGSHEAYYFVTLLTSFLRACDGLDALLAGCRVLRPLTRRSTRVAFHVLRFVLVAASGVFKLTVRR